MKTARIVLIGIVLCVSVVGLWRGVVMYAYPFGRRPATVHVIYNALREYAFDHDGWFPKNENGAYAALQELFPDYCYGDLAGLSGNISATVSALKTGRCLDATLSSWRYFQGFRADDPPEISILWESRAGLDSDGRRSSYGGHVVLFINGRVANIPATSWTNFVYTQERLRRTVLADRVTMTNNPIEPHTPTNAAGVP